MAEVEAASTKVPDFGPVVQRAHVLRASQFGSPALTVICAPAGYGKSVLAAQLARKSAAEVTFWIPLYDLDLLGDAWLIRVAEALGPVEPTGPSGVGMSLELGPTAMGCEAALRIRSALESFSGRTVDVCLDGARRVAVRGPLEELAALLHKHTSPRSRVLVTCRDVVRDESPPDLPNVWLVGAKELRFDSAEVSELLHLAGWGGDEAGRAAHLLDRFSGHPAITALMVRHERIDDVCDPPQDLVWYTRRMAAGLAEDALTSAYCAALLRQGTAGEVAECLNRVDSCEPDWASLCTLVPLLEISDSAPSPMSRFSVHAVLCEALMAEAALHLREELRSALRASVLEHLAGTSDCGRASAVLQSACGEDEVVTWCERNGMSLLYQCGVSVFDRCIARVSPLRLSSSARLLLLRSAALREQERTDEALTHAVLARRIAEAEGDSETQTSALLLEVRLAIDRDDLQRARSVLDLIGGAMRRAMPAPAACLFESYACFIQASSGDFSGAHNNLAHAAALLDSLDKSTQEASWAANTIAGVRGLVMGQWAEVSRSLTSAAGWPGTSPLQALLCRANAAVAHLEMGALQQAIAEVESVRRAVEGARLPVVEAYATTTLAEAKWLAGPAEADALWGYAEESLLERGDCLGPVMGHVHLSALCRAAGRGEEALAHAETALASLQELGDAVRHVRLSAEIEVAASMLSLGDPWSARRLVQRVNDELRDTPALSHRLCATMVLAEIDRCDGDDDSGVARMRALSEYVATGSGNWRMALYTRAFPGLLGLFVSAFGADQLPLRMMRLLPETLIRSAAAMPDSKITQDDLRVLLARANGGEELVSTTDASPPSASTTCHVRLFGGLEVVVDGERVADEHWRKRKVRLLFAMLASRCGQDIPRDVLLERLWPDMDDERARRNFYVTWSAIKRALANGGPPSSGATMLRSSGGVCRTTGAVRVDLQDFDDSITALRRAEAAHDVPATLVVARSLTEIYRGELLPGDIYEEWFAETRERAKHDFCDAMVVAARAAEASGDPDEALTFLRRAGVADPWREDIYQAMMRCQMVAGQRSRAIETYIACRGRLVEDLGIDPSAETTRLYEAVLAMESDS